MNMMKHIIFWNHILFFSDILYKVEISRCRSLFSVHHLMIYFPEWKLFYQFITYRHKYPKLLNMTLLANHSCYRCSEMSLLKLLSHLKFKFQIILSYHSWYNNSQFFLALSKNLVNQDIYKSPLINAQCRSMPINADQNHGIDLNCLSMPIVANQCRSIPINADQCRIKASVKH